MYLNLSQCCSCPASLLQSTSGSLFLSAEAMAFQARFQMCLGPPEREQFAIRAHRIMPLLSVAVARVACGSVDLDLKRAGKPTASSAKRVRITSHPTLPPMNKPVESPSERRQRG